MSEITPLVLIETIIEEGNITAAANKLYVSQPYLSKLLSRVEEEHGLLFFDRLPRAMQLTYAGERYLDYLRRIDDIQESMLSEFDMISKHKRGKIKLGINPTLAASILPVIIPPFIEKYPEISFEFIEDDAYNLNQMLEKRMIDLIYGMLPIETNIFNNYHAYTDRMHLIVPKGNPYYDPSLGTKTTPFPYDDQILSKIPLVTLSEKFGLRRLVDYFYQRKHLSPNIIMEVNTVYTAVGFVRKGMGATFVPVTGMHWPSFNNCNVFEFDTDIFACDYAFSYREDHTFSPTLIEFIESSAQLLASKSKEFRFNVD
ncbi:LysR family transcriptional regulator [Hutsoniella sourekii]